MRAEPLVSLDAGFEPPELIANFRVLAPLGKGGMGKVYLGRELELDRLVALKFMTVPAFVTRARERFLAEARALARLEHPNIVRVFRIDEHEGRPFIAYEYVRGENLEDLLKPVRWQSALAICTRVARALGAAHEAGLLHRDVKPANVMISVSGEVKLLDFGLAIARADDEARVAGEIAMQEGHAELASGQRLTAPGLAVGTPRYWAPEQWQGRAATAATDVYGLGLLAYELLTGHLPYPELTGADLSQALLNGEVPEVDPSLGPRPLLESIARCMRRDPAERYPSGSELTQALERLEAQFLPRGRAEARVGSDEDLVLASWSRLAAAREALGVRTYELLFEAIPGIAHLFPQDLTAQRDKLMHVLNLTIQSLHAPAAVAPMLRELGRKHVAYGVEPGHLDVFGRVFRRALREVDPLWSSEVDAAWEHAYGFISASMRAGLHASRESDSTPASIPMPPSRLRVGAPPRTAYAQIGSSSVAYHVFGSGPPDLVLLPSMLSQVEATWGHPNAVKLLSGLARFCRVMLLDRRGSGLSDPLEFGEPELDTVVADVAAVMSAVGSTRAIVAAASEAGLAGIRLAATRPELVSALVLIGAAPRLSRAPDYPEGHPPEFWDSLATWMAEHWGEPMMVELQAPSASRDPTFTAWLGAYYRLASSPRRALEGMRFLQAADERGPLAKIEAPTLVLHRKGDAMVTLEQGRGLAAAIPGSRFVELEGDDHFVFAGDVDGVAREIERFAAGLARTELASARS